MREVLTALRAEEKKLRTQGSLQSAADFTRLAVIERMIAEVIEVWPLTARTSVETLNFLHDTMKHLGRGMTSEEVKFLSDVHQFPTEPGMLSDDPRFVRDGRRDGKTFWNLATRKPRPTLADPQSPRIDPQLLEKAEAVVQSAIGGSGPPSESYRASTTDPVQTAALITIAAGVGTMAHRTPETTSEPTSAMDTSQAGDTTSFCMPDL